MGLREFRQALGRRRLGNFIEHRACWMRVRLARDPSWVVQRWDGERGLRESKRIAVFVHYDDKGLVHPYILFHLEQLRKAGYSILFVTNSPLLLPAAIDVLKARCGLILLRRNRGYDFGAYKDALREIPDLAALDSLILANDSVYGPFHDLGDLLGRADPNQADIWGITDNFEHHYHLQSYFLLLHPPALAATEFQRFWKDVCYAQTKELVVHHHEIGFSRRMLSAGLQLEALYPYRMVAMDLLEDLECRSLENPDWAARLPQRDYLKWFHKTLMAGIPLNPSHFFWEPLLRRHGYPFLKRELLTRNPCGVPMTQYWESVVRQVSGYDTRLISRHLQHVLHNRCV
ncbi:rhamnan synthesis F family protein [Thiocapsa sp. UBA6158]|uniref:rhamnan synthesis F family protein n=1 Tax=Thiocapsa sp. UBA6158 TaxID=1947692 RepID=UPI0025CE0D48|nr:rhamnan synthesis F family protein [Thiocapsa sp. UBA6158]